MCTAAEAPDKQDSDAERDPGTPVEPETPETPETVGAPEAVAATETPMPAEVPRAEEVELVQPGMHWYVLRVASNKEDQVREALERKVKIEQLEGRVGRVLVPTQREKRMRGGTARVYHRKLCDSRPIHQILC